MKKSEWLTDVKNEIDALKENATKEELSRLDYKSFDPKHADHCVYGQLTGDCATPRAKELMDIACLRVMDFSGKFDEIDDETFTGIQQFINGANKGQGWKEWEDLGGAVNYFRQYKFMSSLEAYIQLKGAKNKSIIQYLKGERNTLNL